MAGPYSLEEVIVQNPWEFEGKPPPSLKLSRISRSLSGAAALQTH